MYEITLPAHTLFRSNYDLPHDKTHSICRLCGNYLVWVGEAGSNELFARQQIHLISKHEAIHYGD